MKKVYIAQLNCPSGETLAKDFALRGLDVMGGIVGETDFQYSAGFPVNPHSMQDVREIAEKVGAVWDTLDILVCNYTIFPSDLNQIKRIQDFDRSISAYDANTIGTLRLINAFMPLLEKGNGKRICFVTNLQCSNSFCEEKGFSAEAMCRSAMNVLAHQLFNDLRPDGYTFRLYCEDTASRGQDGYMAEYFLRDRSYEPFDLPHSDENRLVLRDWRAREIPW